jgi:hypothetical protein
MPVLMFALGVAGPELDWNAGGQFASAYNFAGKGYFLGPKVSVSRATSTLWHAFGSIMAAFQPRV